MKLKDYLLKNRIEPEEFAKQSDLSKSSIYAYLRGRTPHRKTARIIENITNGQVTVEDLRGDES